MHQFIQDAIKGGWRKADIEKYMLNEYGWDTGVFLDIELWKATGETRCWDNKFLFKKDQWKWKMRQFINHLIDGLSIEEALNKI